MSCADVLIEPGTRRRWAARLARNSVKLSCGCRIWTGKTGRSRTGAEYPLVTVRLPGVAHPVNRRAHRIACELATGPIPYGFDVDHTCRQTLCVASGHLVAIPGPVNRGLDAPR
jgi:hypothetical protein